MRGGKVGEVGGSREGKSRRNEKWGSRVIRKIGRESCGEKRSKGK